MTRLLNDLLRVEWDVKPYTLTHSWSDIQIACHVVRNRFEIRDISH